jgi:hypothetical protein
MTSERRADKRFLLHSRVEITGVDKSGLQFAERSQVEDVGDSGCRFTMRGAVHQGGVLGVEPLGTEGENLPDEFPRMFVTMWVKRKGNRLTVGARSLREDEISGGGVHIFCSASSSSRK